MAVKDTKPKLTPAERIRAFIIESLDDEEGINESAYNALQEMTKEPSLAWLKLNEITNQVDSTENRFYLPELHGIKP